MANARLGLVLRQVQQLAAGKGLADVTDGQLLECFSAGQEEAAFAALLHRHGPMVLGVARRVLHQVQDAEDVFQAAFLLLARKAGSIRKQDSVGSWLHGVAYRLAVEARRQATRRQTHERRARAMDQKRTIRAEAWQELEEAPDQALAQLPEKYRTAVVLCCLEGKTQEEAARQLGCPLGTVRSRLARGRDLLRKQLVGCGVTLSTAALATFLAAAEVSAAVPAAVLHRTVSASIPAATGQAIAGAVSPRVAALLEGATKAMVMTKVKTVLALVLTLSILAAGAGLYARQALSAADPAAGNETGAKTSAADRDSGTVREGQTPTDVHGDPLPPDALARLGTMRFRQGNLVGSVAYSADGKVVASRDWNGTLYLWEAGTGKQIRRVGFSQAWLRGLTFFPDGKSLAVVGGWDNSIHFWDFASGREPVPTLGRAAGGPRAINDRAQHNFFTSSFTASPDGKLVASIQYNLIRVWELATGKELGQLKEVWQFDKHKEPFQRLAFSPDSKLLAAVGKDGNLWFWEAATGNGLRRIKGGSAARDTGSLPVAFAPDGKYLAMGEPDGVIRLFDVPAGKEARVLRGPEADVSSIAFSPDGKTLAVAVQDFLVRLWDLAGNNEVRELRGHRSWVTSVAFSPDGKRLVSGGQDNTLHLWDVASGREIGPQGGHDYPVLTLTIAPDGKTVATGAGREDAIRLWDAATGKEIQAIQTRQSWVGGLAFAPDGKWIASAGGRQDRTICLWDTVTGKELRSHAGPDRAITYRCLAFSRDGKALLSGRGDSTLRLWNLATGKECAEFKGHTGEVDSVAFSPDGKTIASAEWLSQENQDTSIRLWDAGTGKEIRRLHGQKSGTRAIAFSPDGRTLASAGSSFDPEVDPDFAEALLLWDVATGQVLRRIAGTPSRSSGDWRHIRSLAFAPDGKTLASGESDNAVVLHETATGRVRGRLAGHEGDIVALAYSVDGRILASAGAGNMALVWDATLGFRKGRTANGPLPPKELEGLWTDLAGEDAARAFRAVQVMATAGPQAVALLKERLRPETVSAEPQRMARLIADLDSDKFAVREEATTELQKLGELAESTLTRARDGRLSAEASRRIGQLLEFIARKRGLVSTAEELRALRAVEVLEQIGTSEARQVLATLAKGTPGARLTREANLALDRLPTR